MVLRDRDSNILGEREENTREGFTRAGGVEGRTHVIRSTRRQAVGIRPWRSPRTTADSCRSHRFS